MRAAFAAIALFGCSGPAPEPAPAPPPSAWTTGPDAVGTGRAPPTVRPGPDLVLVTIDTWRADRLGLYGSPRGATSSTLARWADVGVVFEHAYAPSSWTWPTLASLATGLHPSAHGATTPEAGLCDAPDTLAETLWSQGRRTGFAGSSSYVEPPGERPTDTGFAAGFEYFWARGMADGAAVLARAAAFLDGVGDGPVFLHVHLYDPHCPFDPSPEAVAALGAPFGHAGMDGAWLPDFTTSVREANGCFLVPPITGDPTRELRPGERGTDLQAYLDAYDGELVETDALLGDLQALLASRGRWHGAWVIATGDHGEEFGDHGRIGHGRTAYAETARVPLVVKPPTEGGWARGVRIATPVSLADLPPTIAAVGGARGPRSWQGRDLTSALRGDRLQNAPVFVETDYEGGRARLVIDGGLALHRDAHDGARLFEIARDPGHRHDRAALRPADVARLGASIDGLERDIAKGRVCEPTSRSMSPEQIETLRALGYLGSD